MTGTPQMGTVHRIHAFLLVGCNPVSTFPALRTSQGQRHSRGGDIKLQTGATLVCGLVIGMTAFAAIPESVPRDVQSAVCALRRAQTFDSAAIGMGGGKSDTYRAFELLDAQAGNEVLEPLLQDPNPVASGPLGK
ncbi:MAG: hypothetical protein AAGA68_19385 [Pseudomonadota bacterium]